MLDPGAGGEGSAGEQGGSRGVGQVKPLPAHVSDSFAFLLYKMIHGFPDGSLGPGHGLA